MKRLITSIAISLTALASVAGNLVILHTNDTHSAIDPDDKGLGGIVRRKVLIDSVRASQPNVLLVDAGDAVQGNPIFYTLRRRGGAPSDERARLRHTDTRQPRGLTTAWNASPHNGDSSTHSASHPTTTFAAPRSTLSSNHMP